MKKKPAKKMPPSPKQGKRAGPTKMPRGMPMRAIPEGDMPMDERLMARKSGPRVV
jgi:hypothetical protein